jgi:hypothetical protein
LIAFSEKAPSLPTKIVISPRAIKTIVTMEENACRKEFSSLNLIKKISLFE